jgi:hypothetical protein
MNKRVFIVTVVAVVALIVILYSGVAIYKVHRIRGFVDELSSFKLGEATFADARSLATKYGGVPWDGMCSEQHCRFRFVFYNTFLNRIHRRREISLAASMTIEGGYVVSRELDYSILAKTWDDQYMYVVSEDLRSNNEMVKRLKSDSNGRPHWIDISLMVASTKDLRQRAYSLNLSCLVELCGCSTLSDIAPHGL